MKKWLYIFVILTTLLSFKRLTVLDEVVTSLNKGNANQIALNLDQQVSITLPQNSGSFGQAKAAKLLADFLTTNVVKDFSILHKGDNQQAQFCIGLLSTKKGDFRTTIFIRNRNGRFVIQEIRFESN